MPTLTRLLSANSTASAVPTKSLSATRPTGAGVIDLLESGKLKVVLYGAGNDNQTVLAYVFGWKASVGQTFVPTLIGAVTGTLSTAVGLAGEIPLDTERFSDGYAIVSGVGGNHSFEFNGNTANSPGSFVCKVVAEYDLIEIVPIVGNATSVNALVGFVD
jgi:hypothetical protein